MLTSEWVEKLNRQINVMITDDYSKRHDRRDAGGYRIAAKAKTTRRTRDEP
jgi:hypothetical protein